MSSQLRAAQEPEGRRSLQEPLSCHVQRAIETYFLELDGHEPDDLYQMVMEQVERPLLATVMNHTGGNQSRAAQWLGINRGTLRKKLKHYQLA